MNEEKKGLLGRVADRLLRQDSWVNPLTGFGTSRDKTTYSAFEVQPAIPDVELAALYHSDDMAKKVVLLLPKEALRSKIGIKGDAEPNIRKQLKRLDVIHQLKRGAAFGRLFGGAALHLGVDDGQDVIRPLDPKRVIKFDFLELYDRRRCWPLSYYENPASPRYGWPRTYLLQALKGGSTEVHESRLVLFGGADTADFEKMSLNFWDYSVLQACYEPLRQFNENNKAAELLLADASQGVFKMKGLLAAIAGGEQENLTTRAQLLDMGRSVARSIFLDADSNESFDKVATSFAGIASMLDRSANRLAAASDIPVTILMGQAPAGLNATGASDIRVWYDQVASYQEEYITPRLERILRLIETAFGLPEHEISFKSLWQPTGLEKAQERKVIAETDVLYISNEVLTPEQVAENRFGGEEFSSETVLTDEEIQTPNPPIEAKKALPTAKFTEPDPASNKSDPKEGGGRFPAKPGPTLGNPWPTGKP